MYYKRKLKALLVPHNCFDNSEARQTKMMNPSAPTLHDLPKVHKEGTSIQPLINIIQQLPPTT